jgi:hypothetical protein
MQRHNKEYCPVLYNRLTESELWMLRLGSPGEDQLDLMPGNVTGIPPGFQYHPFLFLDWKEEAWVQKQVAKLAKRTLDMHQRVWCKPMWAKNILNVTF